MIEVGTLDMSGGALGDCAQFLEGGFTAAALKTFLALAQSFRDGPGQGFPSLPGDRLGEPVGFRVLDIEAGSVSSLLSHCLSLLYRSPFHRFEMRRTAPRNGDEARLAP